MTQVAVEKIWICAGRHVLTLFFLYCCVVARNKIEEMPRKELKDCVYRLLHVPHHLKRTHLYLHIHHQIVFMGESQARTIVPEEIFSNFGKISSRGELLLELTWKDKNIQTF